MKDRYKLWDWNAPLNFDDAFKNVRVCFIPKPDVYRFQTYDGEVRVCLTKQMLGHPCDLLHLKDELIEVVWPGTCPACRSNDTRWFPFPDYDSFENLIGKFRCWDCGKVW